ncbi:hypothetical protein EVAR_95673_1 [Eumeta japonica]|uniref:Spondin domain-containing protein n=1 Tax=Eumeta variegata TaxID=151549 RepID=A0A4C1VK01_EUMVA|nr:hypothetical protein EVAR_95673_1 [Eumeta japonica]
MELQRKMAVVLILCVVKWRSCSADCEADSVAVYRVKLDTFWSEESFPKDYPHNNPKAQWSQLFVFQALSTWRWRLLLTVVTSVRAAAQTDSSICSPKTSKCLNAVDKSTYLSRLLIKITS